MQSNTSKVRGCCYWLKLLLASLVGFLMMLYVGGIVFYVNELTRPVHSEIGSTTPADLGLDYEEVTIISDDDTILSSWYIPSQNGTAVILLHGSPSNRVEMMGRAEILARSGYGVLLYDRRAEGESEGDTRSFGWLDVNDVLAALDYLQNRNDVDPERIGILGFSLGGQVALRAAAQTDRVKAVAADGPSLASYRDILPPTSLLDRVLNFGDGLVFKGVEWRTGISAPPGVVEVIGDIAPRPVLLIATGTEDDFEQRVVRYYYDHAHEPKTLWEIPEAGHGNAPIVRPEEYKEKIVTFFNQALLEDVAP